MKKGTNHGVRHGKTKEQTEYHMAWSAWKRCCERVDSQGGHCTGKHDRFLRDPDCRESQLAIGWTEQVQRVGWTCTRRPYISSQTRGEEKIPRTMVSYFEHSKQKWAYENSIWFPSLLSQWKSVYTTNQVNKLKRLSIQINAVDGIPYQAHRCGTSLNGSGKEFVSFIK